MMCLREVDKSNVFIGMYGERYGWCKSKSGNTSDDRLIQSAIDIAVKEFSWAGDYQDRSATELEMRMVYHCYLFRVLKKLDPCFFFRSLMVILR